MKFARGLSVFSLQNRGRQRGPESREVKKVCVLSDRVRVFTNMKTMNEENKDTVRAVVREQYAAVARASSSSSSSSPSSSTTSSSCNPGCCSGPTPDASLALGYSADELALAPDGSNMGLGCGNPQAIAGLRAGETVLDLGAGGGFDCFLAAKQVGNTGRVIGVDMTPDMVSKARKNAAKIEATNVEFRLGEIEHLPLHDGSVDVILSNCVINLSPDKAAVLSEAFRVLRPGGRLAISDVLATQSIPDALAKDFQAYTGCVAGAVTVQAMKELLTTAGFEDVRIQVNENSRTFIRDWIPGSGAENFVASATVEAIKPGPVAGAKSCCGPTCCTPESTTP
jgi:arsenite methyltransferase